MNRGTLIVKPLCAKLTIDTEWFGKMDPYTKCTVGVTIQKTHTANDQGKTPSWSDTLSFMTNNEVSMRVEMWDEDVGKDDFIGECDVPLTDVYRQQRANNWYTLKKKGKSSGQVMICFEFYRRANNQPDGVYAGMQKPVSSAYGAPSGPNRMPTPNYAPQIGNYMGSQAGWYGGQMGGQQGGFSSQMGSMGTMGAISEATCGGIGGGMVGFSQHQPPTQFTGQPPSMGRYGAPMVAMGLMGGLFGGFNQAGANQGPYGQGGFGGNTNMPQEGMGLPPCFGNAGQGW